MSYCLYGTVNLKGKGWFTVKRHPVYKIKVYSLNPFIIRAHIKHVYFRNEIVYYVTLAFTKFYFTAVLKCVNKCFEFRNVKAKNLYNIKISDIFRLQKYFCPLLCINKAKIFVKLIISYWIN